MREQVGSIDASKILMKSLQISAQSAPTIGKVLSVSPNLDDHATIERLFANAGGRMPWPVTRAWTVASALTALRQVEFAVIVCDSALGPNSWKDLLSGTQDMMSASSLVVTSLHADERLWAEALNLGAYDVVAKPFYPAELIRVVNSACMRWRRTQSVGDRMLAKVAAC